MTILLVATPLFAQQSAERSKRLTAAAEQLLAYEKKMAADSPDGIEDVLFGDVLALLDSAVTTGPGNVHARALRSEVLLETSYDGEQYDVCYLLDAKGDAEYVISHASRGTPDDITIAKAVLKGIDKIPPDAIPDPPSVCNDDEEGHRGTRTKSQ